MKRSRATLDSHSFARRSAVGIATLGLVALPMAAAHASGGSDPEAPAVPQATWLKEATSEGEVTVRWEPVPGANHYLCNGVTVGNTTTCTLSADADELVHFHVKACYDNTCSAAGTVRAATNPVAPPRVQVTKVTQKAAGGARCVTLKWADVTAVDNYKLEMDRNGRLSGGRIVETNTAVVCGLKAGDRYNFTVTPINRLEKSSGLTGETALFGEPSPESRTVQAVPTTKPGQPSIVAESAYESNPDVKVTGSLEVGKPSDATYIQFKFPDRINYVNVTSGKTATFSGLQWNQDYSIYAAFCNNDGCSAYGTASPKIRSASSPQIWNLTSDASGQASFSTYGMRGNGGYSYRIKYCDRTKTSGCDPDTQADAVTGWITDRNENTVKFNGLKSGNRYAFMYVQSVNTDGTNPKTYSAPKVVTIK